MSLKRKLLEVQIQLGLGNFGESGFDTVKLTGHRVSSTVVKAGGNAMGSAEIQIYGMQLEQMNKLTVQGRISSALRRNVVTLFAADEGSKPSLVFTGDIINGFVNAQSAPNVPFTISALTGLFDAVKPVPVSSFKGVGYVVSMLQSLANLMGKNFQNNGVDPKQPLANPYYSGSAREQVLAIVKHAGIEWNGLDNNELAIWPAGQSRNDEAVLIAPETGMRGYPTFYEGGVIVQTVYNPSIGFGSKVFIQSIFEPANGIWNVIALEHKLDSGVSRGDWYSTVTASPQNVQQVR